MKGVCFGEILWDVFPDGRKLGGAPLNVAFRLNQLGLKTTLISAVGNDQLGNEIVHYLAENHIPSAIQKTDLPTSQVTVELDENGSATYTIESPVAWDEIQLSEDLIRSVSDSDFLLFGSLVCRNEVSKSTLIKLIAHSKFPILDVNLRPPFVDFLLIRSMIEKSKMVKFNEEEIAEYCHYFLLNRDSTESQIQAVIQQTGIEIVCVTQGADGALLWVKNVLYKSATPVVNVVDTVGAGDSFLGALIHGLFTSGVPQNALHKACVVGALVASKSGANPILAKAEIERFNP